MAKKTKKHLGRVVIDLGYVVDLDNQEMVEKAKRNFYDEMMTLDKDSELHKTISVIEDRRATEDDIPEFLHWNFYIDGKIT